MASKEANKAKYQYNKKYLDAYWERKAASLKKEEAETLTEEREVTKTRYSKSVKTTKTKIKTTTTIEDFFFPELYPVDKYCQIPNKDEYTDREKYIKLLEDRDKAHYSEVTRLRRLLLSYQKIIRIGIESIEFDNTEH